MFKIVYRSPVQLLKAKSVNSWLTKLLRAPTGGKVSLCGQKNETRFFTSKLASTWAQVNSYTYFTGNP